MEKYLNLLGYDFMSKSVELPLDLEKLINADFIIDNDCIILSELYGHKSNPIFNDDLEKCEWEFNETHFHPDEYLNDFENELVFLALALESAKRLMHRLNHQFNDKNFRISVSFNETVWKNNEIDSYGSSTVRFYQIRNNCEKAMRVSDLTEFKLDAILEIEIN